MDKRLKNYFVSLSFYLSRKSKNNMPDPRPTCLIGDLSENDISLIRNPLETDMNNQRPIRDLNASVETDMYHQRPTCLIGDHHA